MLTRRAEFVKLVMTLVDGWLKSPATQAIPERSQVTYSLAFAAFTAAASLLESHTKEELAEYKRFVIEHTGSAAEDVSTDVNVFRFVEDLITAFKAGAIPPEWFRLEKKTVPHPPGSPNQGLWDSYQLYFDAKSVTSALQAHLRKHGRNVTLTDKDLQAQLSKCPYWIQASKGKKLNRRFGKKGEMAMATTWGLEVDLHPLGLQDTSDECYNEHLSKKPKLPDDFGPQFADGDPRKGELFSIVEKVETFRAQEEQE